MYLGSVRFFKHFIYVTMAFIMWAVLFGLYFFGSLMVSNPAVSMQVAMVGAQTEPLEETAPDESVDLLEAGVFPRQVEVPSFSPIDYQLKYPELYSEIPDEFVHKKGTAYLTFDDGPSARTLEILDILREQNVKATFFVVTEESNPDILRRIVEEGHSIGIHTNSHRYKEIYSSVEDYLDDFHTAYTRICEVVSVKPEVFRFPGGSINAYNRSIYQELISEMLRRGFLYYDWNISCMDANPNMTSEGILDSIKASVNGQDRLVILAHDSASKHQTVETLPDIIGYIRGEGYSFERCDRNVEPVVFVYPES